MHRQSALHRQRYYYRGSGGVPARLAAIGGLPALPGWVTTDNLFTAAGADPQNITVAGGWDAVERASVTTDAIAGPYRSSFGDFLKEDTTTNTHQVRKSITYQASTAYIQRAVVKGSGADLTLFFSSTTHGSTQQVYFSTTTGAASVAGGTPAYGVTDLGNGWWLFSIQATTTALGAPTAANTIIRLAEYPSTQSYLGDNVSGVYVAAVGLHVA